MEISERELTEMVRAVDETHRSGMSTMPADLVELHHGEGARMMGEERLRVARGIGLGGAAVAIGAAMVPLSQLFQPAFAQSGDAGIAAFAQSVELAAVAAYQAAAASGKVKTPAIATAATTFAGHHKEHAAAFGAAAGSAATGKPNAKLLAALSPQLAAAPDERAVVTLAYGLENSAAATYLFALGALMSEAALQLTASILPVEGQHAVVLGSVLGKPATEYVPSFQTTDTYVDPTKYPVS